MKTPLHIIKIGGNVIDDEVILQKLLKDVSDISDRVIIIHGGGKRATRLAEQLGIPQKMMDGRRLTDQPTLDIATMVYAGLINKNLVSKLCSFGKVAIGLTGADGNLILSHKRQHPSVDYGFVGDIDEVNSPLLVHLLQYGLTPVMCAITHDKRGQLLNTNADTIAQEVAVAMSFLYDVSLIYLFDKAGVLTDIHDENSCIPILTQSQYRNDVQNGVIHSGMIPKIDNAFKAIEAGVSNVRIGKAEFLTDILHDKKGTKII